jgi:chemotaxis protein methyltransferase CheR
MTDQQFVEFLQWALPRLELRWPGLRKVRGQVRKRVNRRLGELGLGDISDYRAHLESHPEEWPVLDRFCRISLSRFYRDRGVFDHLRNEILPALAQMAAARDEKELHCWSAGCASGEEVYTVAILWKTCILPQYRGIWLRQTATDINEQILERARRACYAAGSLKDVPPDWLQMAFTRRWAGMASAQRGGGVSHPQIPPTAAHRAGEEYALRDEFRTGIEFRQQDIRSELPDGPFHLVLCRNLVFTYFAEQLQRKIVGQITQRMLPHSFLVIGKQESLPAGVEGLSPCGGNTGIYRVVERGKA